MDEMLGWVSLAVCACKRTVQIVEPDNADDTMVLISYAATTVDNDHISPFPVRCFVIIFLIVWVYLSALKLLWLNGANVV